MSTWSPTSTTITNVGNALLASARVGLGTVKLTKVVSRENFESTVANLKSYTSTSITPASIAQEGHIMTIKAVDHPDPEEPVETSLVTVRFTNDDFEDETETYNLRQIIIYAALVDPDTQEIIEAECPYMVAQCDDSSDCDVMPAREVNPTSFDYDIYVIHAGVDEVTIEVRTSGYVWQEDFDDYKDDVEAHFDEVDEHIDSSIIGVRNEDKSFASWIPVYDSSHEEWNKTDGATVVGQEGSESYNQIDNGPNSFSTGKMSTAFGRDNEVLADYSFATGESNYVNGVQSFASGKRNAIRGGYANLVSGENNDIPTVNYCNVFGYANVLSNYAYSTLLSGHHLISDTPAATVLGKYNVFDSLKKYALIVGSGSSENSRANAFTVDWTGEIKSDSARHNSIYVGTLYNLDGTEIDIGGGGIPEDFIKRGVGTKSFITNDTIGNTANGPYSSTFGRNNKTGGQNSATFGEDNETSGRSSLVLGGKGNAVRGNYSVASGYNVSINSPLSAAFGADTCSISENAKNSFILGSSYIDISNETETDGYTFVANSEHVSVNDSTRNTVLGAKDTVIEDSSDIFLKGGNNSSIDINDSTNVTAFADDSCSFTNSDNVFAVGERLITSYAKNSTLLGKGLTVLGASGSEVENQTVLGKYNTNDPTKLLIIGNGSSASSRHNALTVDSDGNIFIAESATSLNSKINGALQSSEKGEANGVAELDNNGKVPSSQLPSYVSGTVEGYYYNDKFYEDSAHTTEITPQDNIIYVDLSTEKTYRWSGSIYVEISPSLVLGETSSTAYRGDRGKTAYDHATDSSRLTTAQTTSKLYKFTTTAEGHIASVSDSVSGADVGLGNVTNDTQVKAISGSVTNGGIPLLGSDGATITDSEITIEKNTSFSGASDLKIPTSKAIAQNVADSAVLKNYSATSQTTIQNLSDSDTITEAFEKVQNNVQVNKNNISSLWDNGAKNHYKITATQSTAGITYSKISESELSISGTYTGSTYVYFNLTGNNFRLPAGSWKFRFSTTGTVPNRNITFGIQGQGSTTASKDTDYEFTTTGAEYMTAYVQFLTNDTVDGSIRIMVRPANATDTTYQPYALSNAELTAKEQTNENNITQKASIIDVYGRGTEITANADLDDYKNPGRYHSPNSTRSGTLTHTPVSNAGFVLTVYESYSKFGNQTTLIQTAEWVNSNSYAAKRRMYLYTQSTSTWAWTEWA